MPEFWHAHRKWIAAVAVAAVCGCAAWFFLTIRTASRGLDEAVEQAVREGRIAFREAPLMPNLPAGFEPIASPAQFTDVALYNGKVYLCGPGGLFQFDRDGKPGPVFHAGMEFPPAPLVKMAVGLGPSSSAGPQLWLATRGEGLLAFDGSRFRQMRPEVASARNITAVLPVTTGRILLGTEKAGVLAWDGKSLAAMHPSLTSLNVTALAGSESDLWIGTAADGLVHFHAGQAETLGDLPDPRVLSLTVVGNSAYAGTAVGVAEFQDGRYVRTLAPGKFAKSLFVRNEVLSVGTLEEGVVEIPLTVKQPRLRVSRETSNAELGPMESLVEFDGKFFALATDGLYEQGKRVLPAGNESVNARLTDRNITALAMDRSGRLWVGYFDRGLDVLEPGFTAKRHFEDDHVFCVNRIVHGDGQNLTAVGTANGLVLFDGVPSERRVLTKADGLIAGNVTDVLVHGSSITAATPAGLTFIDGSGTSSLYAFHGLVNNHVYTLASSGPDLMAGTLGGLSRLQEGTVRANYTTANSGLKHNWITAITPVGADWFVGTYGSGIEKLDSKGKWTTYPDLRGQVVVNPNAMALTGRAIYAGTLGRGLAIFNRSTERWNFLTRGLPSLNVTAVTAAGGYLYIGTDNGLIRVAEEQVPNS